MWYRDEFLNYWWNGKVVYLTYHALDELDRFNKTIEFVGEILERGKHKLVSRRQNKYEVTLRIGKVTWKMIYALYENKAVIIRIGVSERLWNL